MSEPVYTGPDEPPYQHYLGREHVFEDGIILRVVQVKQRNDGMYVTYETQYPKALNRSYMNAFNRRLVESLDVINKILAGFFLAVAVLALIEVASESIVGGLLAFLTAITTGIITCGYIALMININKNVQAMRDRIAGPDQHEDWTW
jgi:hypothetical protein